MRFACFALIGCALVACSSGSDDDETGKEPETPPVNVPTGSVDYTKIQGHPRLLMTLSDFEALKEKITVSPELNQLHQLIIARSNTFVTLPELTYQKIGKRLLAVASEALNRIFHCAYSYRMTGDKRYLDKAERELVNICRFQDWNPSHFLDVAEMSAAVAFGYDWLYPELKQETKDLVISIIDEKAFTPSFEKPGIFKRINNWNQVCNGGLTVAALAVFEDMMVRSKDIVERALGSNKLALAAYGPDGCYNEGYGYWGYGTSYQVLMLGALESIFGNDHGLSNIPGFSKTPGYILHMTGVNGKVFNYSDNGEGDRPQLPMWWFARKYRNLSYLYNEMRFLAAGSYSGGEDRLLPMVMAFAANLDLEQVKAPEEKLWYGGGDTPVVLIHGDWTRGETDKFVGIKAGRANTDHGQMDVGSFVYDAMGCRWSTDLGSEDYNTVETAGIDLFNVKQNSDRWTKVFRTSLQAHSTLSIAGELHRVDGACTVTETYDTDAERGAMLDMTATLGSSVSSATRTIKLLNEQDLEIVDKIKMGAAGKTIRWTMTTVATPEKISDRCWKLSQNGKVLYLTISSTYPVTLKTWEPSFPDCPWNNPNTGVSIIGFESAIAGGASTSYTVLLTPTVP